VPERRLLISLLLIAACAGCGAGGVQGRHQPTGPPAESALPTPSQGGFTYAGQRGDTLWDLATRFYGDGRLWRVIYEANREKLSEPSVLAIGTELWIPPKPQGEFR
jgi:nucleoid-associated protein YgaU